MGTLRAADMAIETTIVDVPTVRRHHLSAFRVTAQSDVIVQVRLAGGAQRVGEASTLGGPRWSEESVEDIKAAIDAYIAPALLGQPGDAFEAVGARMDRAATRNNAAKAAIEAALLDAVARMLEVPVSTLLGGVVREKFPVFWTLASGDAGQEIEEAQAKLGARLHDRFLGAAAHLLAFAGLRTLAWDCEQFGPQILVDDLATEPLRYADYAVYLPTGPGSGVTLDSAKLRRFARS